MLPEGVRPWYQEWRDEGWREGKREGEAAVLERQLTIRFGKLPAEVRGRLQKARSEELMRWAERCLTAESLGDVFGD